MPGTVGISKIMLSPSGTPGDGTGKKLTGSLVTMHTAIATADGIDEIWLWAYNSHTTDLKITVTMGGTDDPDDHIVYDVPFDDGAHLIVPGLVLTGGLNMSAMGETTNLITVFGYVNRIWTATA